jgi:hypothetical protein
MACAYSCCCDVATGGTFPYFRHSGGGPVCKMVIGCTGVGDSTSDNCIFTAGVCDGCDYCTNNENNPPNYYDVYTDAACSNPCTSIPEFGNSLWGPGILYGVLFAFLFVRQKRFTKSG